MTALSQKEQTLLLMAVKKNDGVVSMSLAKQVYNTSGSAKSAIQSFELHDLVERTAPGHWKIVKLPEDVKREIRLMRESKNKEEDYEKEEIDLE